MKRAATVLLVLIAAFAAPVRQACGTTCVEPAPIEQAAAEPAGCHKPDAPTEPDPAPEHCTHDHTASLNAASRVALATGDDQSAFVRTHAPAPSISSIALARGARSSISPGSPPLRLVTLRI